MVKERTENKKDHRIITIVLKNSTIGKNFNFETLSFFKGLLSGELRIYCKLIFTVFACCEEFTLTK
jgi:hypothetical protein